MRKNKLAFLLLVILFLSGCKKDEDVNTPVNNNGPSVDQVVLVSPSNNSTVDLTTTLLKWEQYLNSGSYKVQLSMDANFISPSVLDTSINALEINVPAGRLTTNIYYYWRVIADLGNGNFSNWSNVSRFRIILAAPPAPVLTSPPNNSIDQSYLPLFDWNETPTAVTYRLQLSENAAFSPVLLDSSNIPLSELQCPHFYLGTGSSYFWRVNASNSNGVSTGDWSAVFNFRTVEGTNPSSINGTVTFTDNNFVPPPYMYFIAAYRTNEWPPEGSIPGFIDSLNIVFINNQYIANYTIRNVPDGDYRLAVFTTTRSISFEYVYKSVFGCDTSRVVYSDCPLINPGTVNMSNGMGVTGINMLSWADTSKSIF